MSIDILYNDILNIIVDYAQEYQLLKWIDINKINWNRLSLNPNAIDLSLNLNAIDLLECGGSAPTYGGDYDCITNRGQRPHIRGRL